MKGGGREKQRGEKRVGGVHDEKRLRGKGDGAGEEDPHRDSSSNHSPATKRNAANGWMDHPGLSPFSSPSPHPLLPYSPPRPGSVCKCRGAVPPVRWCSTGGAETNIDQKIDFSRISFQTTYLSKFLLVSEESIRNFQKWLHAESVVTIPIF